MCPNYNNFYFVASFKDFSTPVKVFLSHELDPLSQEDPKDHNHGHLEPWCLRPTFLFDFVLEIEASNQPTDSHIIT